MPVMQVANTIADFRALRLALPGSVGLVPTMGYLHAGHIELVKRATAENDQTVASIFVNPLQFGPSEDFAAYPRDLERDLAMLREAGTALVFAPPPEEMYPPGFQTYVDVMGVSQGLEGARRPGHFRGVATVVAKLMNIVGADRSYFGQKDAQQVAVIRQMVRDLAIPTQVVVVPTVREADGLALSSRNVYLTPEQRAAAPVLYRALTAAAEAYAGGERSAEALRAILRRTLTAEPLADVRYLSVADAETLTELDGTIMRPALLSLAVRIGQPTLIDNLTVG